MMQVAQSQPLGIRDLPDISSPEIEALRQMRARHRLARRLDERAQSRTQFDNPRFTASPERREKRRIEKDAARRKKAERKRSRR